MQQDVGVLVLRPPRAVALGVAPNTSPVTPPICRHASAAIAAAAAAVTATASNAVFTGRHSNAITTAITTAVTAITVSGRPADLPSPSSRANGMRAASTGIAARPSACATTRLGIMAAAGKLASADSSRRKSDQQNDRAVGAEPAVAHDRKLCGPVAAAAEPVADIGETVLVQRAGQRRAGAER